ncbi:hypothetical protein CLOSTASPAR_01482 [[Clostridium] asparagiforme DSM 15981]|uniref:Uncharacterized protein n=1 Tax=[Clostridium] asparagiforme DSM 15981 TaxID=518636 RepID=C0CWW1_9FIRM|nr:hypothetical protein CLOSTASPAR_01482 [[Clostridium] asparagiforme DSM 15981]
MLFIEHFCCRGLRRPRGLKSRCPRRCRPTSCRGLRRPRGLKFVPSYGGSPLAASRSAKASWIEIGGGQAPPAGGKSRGLRRPRGLKSSGKNGYISTVLVEVCEGLVD